ncbi:Sulfhydryl oxidase 2 [Heterocephalus glaber]|uniref:Sulfhydryl oxidase n=1 Tax=Heterocephalus glaber TaxID=10181 RepID=G5B6B8_HETGA|nr:Sulfhydryl oxidase 2 [Heterocephalus glaber]
MATPILSVLPNCLGGALLPCSRAAPQPGLSCPRALGRGGPGKTGTECREDGLRLPAAEDCAVALLQWPGPARQPGALGTPPLAWSDDGDAFWSTEQEARDGASSVSSGCLSGSSGGHVSCAPPYGPWKERPPRVPRPQRWWPRKSDPRLERLRDRIRQQARGSASCTSLSTSASSSASHLCSTSTLAAPRIRRVTAALPASAHPGVGIRVPETQGEDQASPGAGRVLSWATQHQAPGDIKKAAAAEGSSAHTWPHRPTSATSDRQVSENTASLASHCQRASIQSAMATLGDLGCQMQAGLELAQGPGDGRKHRPSKLKPKNLGPQGPRSTRHRQGGFRKSSWIMTEGTRSTSDRPSLSHPQQPGRTSAEWQPCPQRACAARGWDLCFRRPPRPPEELSPSSQRPWSALTRQGCPQQAWVDGEDWEVPVPRPWRSLERPPPEPRRPWSGSFLDRAGPPCKAKGTTTPPSEAKQAWPGSSPGKGLEAQPCPPHLQPRGPLGRLHSSKALRDFMHQKAQVRRQQVLQQAVAAMDALERRSQQLQEVYRKQREAVQGQAVPVVSQTSPGIVTFVPSSTQSGVPKAPGSLELPELGWSKVTSGKVLGDQEVPGRTWNHPETPLPVSATSLPGSLWLQDQARGLHVCLDPQAAERLGLSGPLQPRHKQARLQALETMADVLQQRVDILTAKLCGNGAPSNVPTAPACPGPLVPRGDRGSPHDDFLDVEVLPWNLESSPESQHQGAMQEGHWQLGQRLQRDSAPVQAPGVGTGSTLGAPAAPCPTCGSLRLEDLLTPWTPRSCCKAVTRTQAETMREPLPIPCCPRALSAGSSLHKAQSELGAWAAIKKEEPPLLCRGPQEPRGPHPRGRGGHPANFQLKSLSFLQSLKDPGREILLQLDQRKQEQALALLRQGAEQEVWETQMALEGLLFKHQLQRLTEKHGAQTRPGMVSKPEQPQIHVGPEPTALAQRPMLARSRSPPALGREVTGSSRVPEEGQASVEGKSASAGECHLSPVLVVALAPAPAQSPLARLSPRDSAGHQGSAGSTRSTKPGAGSVAAPKQSLREEELRAQHRAALLRLRRMALEEMARAELAWLEHLRGCLGSPGHRATGAAVWERTRQALSRLEKGRQVRKQLLQAGLPGTDPNQKGSGGPAPALLACYLEGVTGSFAALAVWPSLASEHWEGTPETPSDADGHQQPPRLAWGEDTAKASSPPEDRGSPLAQDWAAAIRVAVLDCAEEKNQEVCRAYDIHFYPTFRYFKAFTKEFTTGENFRGPDRELRTVRRTMIDFLQNHTDSSRPPACPGLDPIPPRDVLALLGSHRGHYMAVLFESNSSYVGREVILDLIPYENVVVNRALDGDRAVLEKLGVATVPACYLLHPNGSHGLVQVRDPRATFALRLGLDSGRSWSLLACAHFRSRAPALGSPVLCDFLSPVTPAGSALCRGAGLLSPSGHRMPAERADACARAKPLRSFFSSYLKSLPDVRKKSLSLPEKPNKEESTEVVAWREFDRQVAKLYTADLESGLHYLLRVELAAHRSLAGAELKTLRDFMTIVAKLFPGRPPVRKLLVTLQEWLATLPLDRIPYNAVLDLVNNKMRISGIFLPSRVRWVGCQGSRPELRGYPCSLWKLFHTLTVQASSQPDALAGTGLEEDPQAVLQAIRRYVRTFFGCRECGQHFEEMATESLDSVKTADQAVLWLWRSHNAVNSRLAGQLSEDPKFPKVPWPTPDLCPACHEEILSESPQHLLDVRAQSPRGPRARGEAEAAAPVLGIGFSSLDMSLCLVLYVASSLFLMLMYFFFRVRSKRWKVRLYHPAV